MTYFLQIQKVRYCSYYFIIKLFTSVPKLIIMLLFSTVCTFSVYLQVHKKNMLYIFIYTTDVFNIGYNKKINNLIFNIIIVE